MTDCETCRDKGFARAGSEVTPCPRCNPDSGYEPGEYEAQLIRKRGRCENSKGGGGRICSRYRDHPGPHIFQCGV